MEHLNNQLGFKNHNPFYLNLYKNLDDLHKYSLNANRDLANVKSFYLVLKSCIIHYSPYIDKKKIDKDIEKVEEVLLSTKMHKELKNGKFRSDESKELLKKMFDVLNTLNTMHTELMVGLKRHNLLPQ